MFGSTSRSLAKLRSPFSLKRAGDLSCLILTQQHMATSEQDRDSAEASTKPKIRVGLDNSWRDIEGKVIAEETQTKTEHGTSTMASFSATGSGSVEQKSEAQPMEAEGAKLNEEGLQQQAQASDPNAKLAAQRQQLREAKAMKELHEHAKDDAAGPTFAPRVRPGGRAASRSSGTSRSSTSSSSSSTRSRGRSRRRKAQRRSRARSAPTVTPRAWPPAIPMLGHPPLHIEMDKRPSRRGKKMKRFVIDFCRVIDRKEFDLEALQNAFRSMQIVVDTSEMVAHTKLSKTQVMMRLDKTLAKTIRLFEMGSHFFLCEPLIVKKADNK